MHITELARLSGASADEIRYMERKGFINPIRIRPKHREVRRYQVTDIQKAQLLIKYRREGFTWDAAFQKALLDLEAIPLLQDS